MSKMLLMVFFSGVGTTGVLLLLGAGPFELENKSPKILLLTSGGGGVSSSEKLNRELGPLPEAGGSLLVVDSAPNRFWPYSLALTSPNKEGTLFGLPFEGDGAVSWKRL